MKTYSIAIIGGGASGLFLATSIKNAESTILFERGERVGRKLSATGNGQGNVTNLAVKNSEYFWVERDENSTVEATVKKVEQHFGL